MYVVRNEELIFLITDGIPTDDPCEIAENCLDETAFDQFSILTYGNEDLTKEIVDSHSCLVKNPEHQILSVSSTLELFCISDCYHCPEKPICGCLEPEETEVFTYDPWGCKIKCECVSKELFFYVYRKNSIF